MKRLILVVLVAAFAIAMFAVVAFLLTQRSTPTRTTYPNPNGYDTLVAAGESMEPITFEYGTTEDVDELRSFLDANEAALTQIDQAAEQEIVVPIGLVSSADTLFAQHQGVVSALRLLVIKARLAHLEGRNDDAIADSLKLLQLADAIDNEGVIINCMTALAYKRAALDEIAKVAEDLSDEEKENLASEQIDSIVVEPIDVEALLEREFALGRKDMGFFQAMIAHRAASEMVAPAVEALKDSAFEFEQEVQKLSDSLRE